MMCIACKTQAGGHFMSADFLSLTPENFAGEHLLSLIHI